MSRPVNLRPWQAQALEAFTAGDADFLAVATPGAGKTTFALAAALSDMAADRRRRLIVVAPTAHLKTQWAQAAARFGVHLDPEWASTSHALPADMHGIVVTYQQVSASAHVLARVAPGAVAIFDEIHHAGAERSWGDALRVAFTAAGRRLSLSGTPFRSDTNAIPFVRYVGDEAEPDFEYGYGDALADAKVVRPVFFPRTDGRMEWTGADGMVRSATFADRLDATGASQRLRTALALHGEWLPAVLEVAHARLGEIRRAQPDAGGLVIATDQEHARGIAAMLGALGVRAVVATSEDADASARISRFATGTEPWLVAVRMVSEGVDIPRLRVGVYATTTTTELFFRQAVGRFVRWRPGLQRQQAYLFLPDDVRLRRWAAQIAEQRRHSLRRTERDDTVEELEQRDHAGEPTDQLSLFAAISATPLGSPAEAPAAFDDVAAEPDPGDDGTLAVMLAPPPPLPGRGGGPDRTRGGPPVTRQAHKRKLRSQNMAKVRSLARLTGLDHQKVNLELNRRVGIRTIGQATVDQLERRLRSADEWLRRL